MRIIVTGSRLFADRDKVFRVLDGHYDDWLLGVDDTTASYPPFTVIHGACPTGADRWADEWVTDYTDSVFAGPDITVIRCPANWKEFGLRAGPIRNQEMINMGADLVIAFFQYGATNRGTVHCVNTALRAHIDVESHWSGPVIETVELPEQVQT